MLSISNFKLRKALFVILFVFSILTFSASILASVDISGTLEAEVGFGDDFAGNSTSDVTQATLELGIDAEISEWIGGHVLLLYEEGDTPIEVDEAFIEVGNPFLSGFSLKVGQQYIPFGSFETNLISDPLTLEIAETRESALVFTYDNGIVFSAYLFNGDVIEEGGDDSLDNFGINLGYAFEGESFSFEIGFGYINNMGESDGISGIIGDNQQEALGDAFESPTQLSYVAGMNAHLIFSWGMFTFIGELSAAMDEFQAGELNADFAAKPSASNLELALGISDSVTIAVAIQNSVDSVALGLPETRLLIGASYALDDATGIAIEFASDEDYSTEDGGTGESASTITIQFATSF